MKTQTIPLQNNPHN